MKKMHILLMSFVLISLLILGCGKATNPVDVPLSEDSGVISLAKSNESEFDMTDTVSRAVRSKMMSSIRAKDASGTMR